MRSERSYVVAGLATLSVLTIAGSGAHLGSDARLIALPHLIAIGLILTGYPRSGDLLALVAGGVIAFYAGVITLLSFEPRFALICIVQVATCIAALVNLWRLRNVPLMSVSRTHRLVGVGVTLTIAIVAQLMLRASLGKKEALRAKIAAKADEARRTAQALEVAHRVPDTASITSDEWTGHDARAPLMALARCVELFSGPDGGPFPLSLRELQRWSRNDERSGGCASTLAVSREDSSAMYLSASDGHLMRYGHPSAPTPMDGPGPFTLESEAIWDAVRFPFDARRVGVRNYLRDTSGTLHVTDQQRRATERDSVVPLCVQGESATVTSCVVKYAPRERWGAFGFPVPRIMMRRDVCVGDELGPTFSFTPVNALDSIANVTVQWGDALPDTPQVVQVRAPISDDRNAMTATLTHVYPTPGARQLTFVVTTRSGVPFETRDSILMQPPTHGPLHD